MEKTAEENKRINKLIAEKLMGWTWAFNVGYPNPNVIAYKDNAGKTILNFEPSTNIKDAWIALEKVCEDNNWRAIIDKNATYSEVGFKNQMGGWMQFLGSRETTELAICEVILDSMGIMLCQHNEALNEGNEGYGRCVKCGEEVRIY